MRLLITGRELCFALFLPLYLYCRATVAQVTVEFLEPVENPRGQQRVVDRIAEQQCIAAGGEPGCSYSERPPPVRKRISIRLPDFTAADLADKHMITELRGTRWYTDIASIDDDGVAKMEMLDFVYPQYAPMREQDIQDEKTPQYLLTTVDGDTLEPEFTFDVQEARLTGLLGGLESSLQTARRRAAADKHEILPQPIRNAAADASRMPHFDRRLTLAGERMNPDALVTAIFRTTGCRVQFESEAFWIVACPNP
jgi:hypothetical protein